jgi:hypothetical protein
MERQTKAGSKALPGQNYNPGLEIMTFFFQLKLFQLKIKKLSLVKSRVPEQKSAQE